MSFVGYSSSPPSLTKRILKDIHYDNVIVEGVGIIPIVVVKETPLICTIP